MILHLSAASHHITAGRIKDTVTGSSGDIHCFQNVDMGSFHLPVSYQKAGCCQRCQSASDNVSIFAIDTFRFFRSCKSFVVAVAVINTFAVLFIFSTLGIAVIFSLVFSFCLSLSVYAHFLLFSYSEASLLRLRLLLPSYILTLFHIECPPFQCLRPTFLPPPSCLRFLWKFPVSIQFFLNFLHSNISMPGILLTKQAR